MQSSNVSFLRIVIQRQIQLIFCCKMILFLQRPIFINIWILCRVLCPGKRHFSLSFLLKIPIFACKTCYASLIGARTQCYDPHDDVIKWKHFSPLLAICAGNSPVTGEYPTERPATRNFDVFFDLRLNKRLGKQSRRRWFETSSHPLWRHCNFRCCIAGYMNNFFP